MMSQRSSEINRSYCSYIYTLNNFWYWDIISSFIDIWDSKFDIGLHRVYWVCGTDSGGEEDEPDIANKSQYSAWFTWNSSAYGHVCIWMFNLCTKNLTSCCVNQIVGYVKYFKMVCFRQYVSK